MATMCLGWGERNHPHRRLTSVRKSRPKWISRVGSRPLKSTVEMKCWCIGGPDRSYKEKLIIFQIWWIVISQFFLCFAVFLYVNRKRPILGFQRPDDPFRYRTSAHHPNKHLAMIANAQKGIWAERDREDREPEKEKRTRQCRLALKQ